LELRSKVRDAGGEFHIIKNTLGKLAFTSRGYEAPDDHFLGSTALGIAYDDPPSLAKAIFDYSKQVDFVKIKGGFLGKKHLTAEEIITLASLPPLPVARAQLLSTLLAPASQLSRLLAEPGRQIAQVLKSYADSESVTATA
jgi:large subunit ribosomal protein L10